MESEETGKPNLRKKDQNLIESDTEMSNSIRQWLALYRSRVYELYYPIEQPSKEQNKESHWRQ